MRGSFNCDEAPMSAFQIAGVQPGISALLERAPEGELGHGKIVGCAFVRRLADSVKFGSQRVCCPNGFAETSLLDQSVDGSIFREILRVAPSGEPLRCRTPDLDNPRQHLWPIQSDTSDSSGFASPTTSSADSVFAKCSSAARKFGSSSSVRLLARFASLDFCR